MSWNELGQIFPDIHGWWISEEFLKTITVLVPEKYENIPDVYFSQTLGELVILEQEVSGPIIPY
ncbi:hypothetical protein A9K97_gp269 [Tokyovirus A1]|uniref:hypothetical protein n=1 Tax=Tokyovirus A1 TaxID=1826170 RepID=UPI0007A976B8|nr:hypothetical protein A9K97_gp269 [Tokyovirus A1]BAU80082.1 hypothetical protein [Tokyovirus A1]